MLRDLADQPAPLSLSQALRIHPQTRLAIVGAGGKTSALFVVARELLHGSGPRSVQPLPAARGVLATTTTHLSMEQCAQADHHIIVTEGKAALQSLAGLSLYSGPELGDGRVGGLDRGGLQALVDFAVDQGLPLLVEADGSRQLPLKAPAEHEPALLALEKSGAAWMDAVIVIAGLSGLNQPLTEQWVHRPKLFAGLTGLGIGEPITSTALARLLKHPQGGMKNIPPGVSRIALLAQADTALLQASAGEIAQDVLGAYQAVVVASLRASDLPGRGFQPEAVHAVYESIAGIVLAAGGSQRFGQPKIALEWRGKSFIQNVVETALSSGLDPVIVVCGAEIEQVRSLLNGMPVVIIYNRNWEAGQSTSIRAGLAALPAESGGALFLLADQPHIPSVLITALVEDHAASLASLTAPQAAGRRANPVLFDRRTFPDLQRLEGDVGGRAIFSKYPIRWLPWHDANILLDVDTPDDYRKLQELSC
jgi:molybdenum cofactor cytidylyltransferase